MDGEAAGATPAKIASDSDSDGFTRGSGKGKPTAKSKKEETPTKGRHGSRLGGKKRYCRGCKKTLPSEHFALNQTLDVECKKICDNLRAMAKRQDQLSWWEKVQVCERAVNRRRAHNCTSQLNAFITDFREWFLSLVLCKTRGAQC